MSKRQPATRNLQPVTCNPQRAASLEIACFTLASALTAVRAGADRIEFTADYAVGGVTPSVEDFDVLRKATELPIYVLVRPRGGNFCHTEEEIAQMEKSIRAFHERGADGFVFGCLTAENTIDQSANARLIKATQGKPITFHRAFDEVADYETALEHVIELGCSAILTSGIFVVGANNHSPLQQKKRIERWKELICIANKRIEIIIGGGIRSGNISELKQALNANFYHSACITQQGGEADEFEIKRILHVLKT